MLLVVAAACQAFWSLQPELHFCSRSICHRCSDDHAFQLHISHCECRSKSRTRILLAFTFICLSLSHNLRGCRTGKSIRGTDFAPSCEEGLLRIFSCTKDSSNHNHSAEALQVGACGWMIQKWLSSNGHSYYYSKLVDKAWLGSVKSSCYSEFSSSLLALPLLGCFLWGCLSVDFDLE